jgi:hypothetical protein
MGGLRLGGVEDLVLDKAALSSLPLEREGQGQDWA